MRQSYFVVVAKDPSFGTIVDEAFTLDPGLRAEEPAQADDLHGRDDDLLLGGPARRPTSTAARRRRSTPLLGTPHGLQEAVGRRRPCSTRRPSRSSPTSRGSAGRATEGARRYHLQVSSDASFSNLLDDVITDATSYSSNTTYPANTVLYWRVRADDENKTGLTWSATGTFQKTLAKPTPSASNPTSGGMLPVWSWAPVQGASSYDVSVDLPNGSHRDFPDLRTPAISFIKMTGTGRLPLARPRRVPERRQRRDAGPVLGDADVHAHDRRSRSTRTRTRNPDHVVLSWDPRIGVKEYKVQIAKTPDFSNKVEDDDHRQHELRADDDAVRLPVGRHALLARRGRGRGPQPGRLVDGPADPAPAADAHLGHRQREAQEEDPVTLKVSTTTGSWVAGVLVRVTGPGMKPITKRTNAVGNAVFKVKPKKKGKLFFTVTKAGFQPAYGTLRVT